MSYALREADPDADWVTNFGRLNIVEHILYLGGLVFSGTLVNFEGNKH